MDHTPKTRKTIRRIRCSSNGRPLTKSVSSVARIGTTWLAYRLCLVVLAFETGTRVSKAGTTRMYKQFAKSRDSRAVAGVAFEAASQVRLQDRMNLKCLPIVHLPRNQGDSLPQ